MKDPVTFLSANGDKRFVSKTSRLFHSRKNDFLLKIDESLRQYHQYQPTTSAEKAAALLTMNMRINNYIDNHIDKNGAQRHGFRLPVVSQLQEEVLNELSTCRPEPPRTAPPQYGLVLPRQGVSSAPPPPMPQPAPVSNGNGGGNWDKLRNGIRQVIPQGSIAPGTNSLKTVNGVTKVVTNGQQPVHLAVHDRANNWLEVLKKEHTRGDKLFAHFTAWRDSPAHGSFNDYLDKLPKETKDELTEYQVYHAKDLVARALFEAHFENGQLQSRMNPNLQDDIIATRGAEDAKQRIRHLASENKNPEPLDTTQWPCLAFKEFDSKGWACFVMSSYNTVYVGKHQGGQFHHSSFLGGAPVLAAGMLKVVNGKIVEIHSKNGHYQADSEDLKSFLKHLQGQGVDLAEIKVQPWGDKPVSAQAMLDGSNTPWYPNADSEYSSMAEVQVPKEKPPANGSSASSDNNNAPEEKVPLVYV